MSKAILIVLFVFIILSYEGCNFKKSNIPEAEGSAVGQKQITVQENDSSVQELLPEEALPGSGLQKLREEQEQLARIEKERNEKRYAVTIEQVEVMRERLLKEFSLKTLDEVLMPFIRHGFAIFKGSHDKISGEIADVAITPSSVDSLELITGEANLVLGLGEWWATDMIQQDTLIEDDAVRFLLKVKILDRASWQRKIKEEYRDGPLGLAQGYIVELTLPISVVVDAVLCILFPQAFPGSEQPDNPRHYPKTIVIENLTTW